MSSGRNDDEKLLRKHILCTTLFVVILRLFYCFIFLTLANNYYDIDINLEDFRLMSLRKRFDGKR